MLAEICHIIVCILDRWDAHCLAEQLEHQLRLKTKDKPGSEGFQGIQPSGHHHQGCSKAAVS